MPHYAALRDYRFEDEADDLRGTILRDPSGEKIGIVKDAVIEHETGEVHYLVVDIGSREALVPVERVIPSPADEDDLYVDLTSREMEKLQSFDDSSFGRETEHHPGESSASAAKTRDERAEKEYDENYTEGAVAHREGSDRLITPEAEELPKITGESDIDSSRMTPNRIADKFGGVSQPMTAPTGIPGEAGGAPDIGGRTTLKPEVSRRAEEASHPGSSRGKRWERFETNLRSHLPKLQKTCTVCGAKHRAA